MPPPRDALAVVPATHLYLRKQVWCGAIPTISRRENEANFIIARHYSSCYSFSTFPTTPLLYRTAAIELLTTPTHTTPLLSSANTSPPPHRTTYNHGYNAVAEYPSAAIMSPGLCASSPENDEKGT
jgi:hypothetical protein